MIDTQGVVESVREGGVSYDKEVCGGDVVIRDLSHVTNSTERMGVRVRVQWVKSVISIVRRGIPDMIHVTGGLVFLKGVGRRWYWMSLILGFAVYGIVMILALVVEMGINGVSWVLGRCARRWRWYSSPLYLSF